MGKLTIPLGATKVRAESTPSGSYMLVYTMKDGGEIRKNLGPDMLYAAKIASKVGHLLRLQGGKG